MRYYDAKTESGNRTYTNSLRVRANIGGCPVAYTLNLHRVSLTGPFIATLLVLLICYRIKCDMYVQRTFYTYTNWRISLTQPGNVYFIYSLVIRHIFYVQCYRDYVRGAQIFILYQSYN